MEVDYTPEKAVRQLKVRNFVLCFRGKLGEQPKFTGRILAVGISCDRKQKSIIARQKCFEKGGFYKIRKKCRLTDY